MSQRRRRRSSIPLQPSSIRWMICALSHSRCSSFIHNSSPFSPEPGFMRFILPVRFEGMVSFHRALPSSIPSFASSSHLRGPGNVFLRDGMQPTPTLSAHGMGLRGPGTRSVLPNIGIDPDPFRFPDRVEHSNPYSPIPRCQQRGRCNNGRLP